jgi:hypothetical protein
LKGSQVGTRKRFDLLTFKRRDCFSSTFQLFEQRAASACVLDGGCEGIFFGMDTPCVK